MGLRTRTLTTTSGRWESRRPVVDEFTLADLNQVVNDCRAAGLPDETVLKFERGGQDVGPFEKAAIVLDAIPKES